MRAIMSRHSVPHLVVCQLCWPSCVGAVWVQDGREEGRKLRAARKGTKIGEERRSENDQIERSLQPAAFVRSSVGRCYASWKLPPREDAELWVPSMIDKNGKCYGREIRELRNGAER